MKRRSKALIFADYADAIKCVSNDKKVKRSKNKDGSITTKPKELWFTDDAETDHQVGHLYILSKSEKEVLQECLKWLRKNGCVADRMNVGGGRLGTGEGQYYTYGIPGAGDILAILPNGRHLEVECKAGSGGRWSLAQQKRAKKIQRNKGIYLIVHSAQELEYYLKDYL